MNIRSVGRKSRHALAAIALAATLTVTAACSTPAADASANQPGGSSANRVLPAEFTTDTTPTGQSGITQHVITVSGTGIASGTPDTLTVQLGVQTQGPTAGKALSDNNTKANALIASLHKQGVDTKDITTSDLSISPTFDQSGTKITAYQVSNTVTATLRQVDKAGAVIDAAAGSVGDAIRLNQVGFSFDDDSALRATARADAVKQAMTQAKQLADAAGVSLGKVVSITENDTSSTPQPVFDSATASASGASMPVVAGEGHLAISVQVVVSIG